MRVLVVMVFSSVCYIFEGVLRVNSFLCLMFYIYTNCMFNVGNGHLLLLY